MLRRSAMRLTSCAGGIKAHACSCSRLASLPALQAPSCRSASATCSKTASERRLTESAPTGTGPTANLNIAAASAVVAREFPALDNARCTPARAPGTSRPSLGDRLCASTQMVLTRGDNSASSLAICTSSLYSCSSSTPSRTWWYRSRPRWKRSWARRHNPLPSSRSSFRPWRTAPKKPTSELRGTDPDRGRGLPAGRAKQHREPPALRHAAAGHFRQ